MCQPDLSSLLAIKKNEYEKKVRVGVPSKKNIYRKSVGGEEGLGKGSLKNLPRPWGRIEKRGQSGSSAKKKVRNGCSKGGQWRALVELRSIKWGRIGGYVYF